MSILPRQFTIMKASVFGFAALLAVAVSGHSFIYDDISLLTEMLIDQHDSHPLEEPVARTRRETNETNGNRHRRHKHRFTNPPFKYCCGGYNNTDLIAIEAINEIDKICFEKLHGIANEWSLYGNPTKDPFTCERMKKFRDDFYCINECSMKAAGVLREDGSVDTDAAKLYYIKDIVYDWLKELAVNAVEKCATKTGSLWMKNGENLKCSTRAVDLKQCVWGEIILTCPDEYQEKSDYCERVKIAFEDASA